MTSESIDLTNIVENMKGTFVIAAKDYLVSELLTLPGLGIAGRWFIEVLAGAAIAWLLTRLSNSVMMIAFFESTTIRKLHQSFDYMNAVEAKNNLGPTANQEDYENAERLEISTFAKFVSLAE